MVRPVRWVWLAEPSHLVLTVRRMLIAEFGQPFDEGSRTLQIGDTDEDVDDRFGSQPRHRRAANVMNAARDCGPKRPFEVRDFLLEPFGPRRVIRLDANRLHASSVCWSEVGVNTSAQAGAIRQLHCPLRPGG